jgi:hypothetical protein
MLQARHLYRFLNLNLCAECRRLPEPEPLCSRERERAVLLRHWPAALRQKLLR